MFRNRLKSLIALPAMAGVLLLTACQATGVGTVPSGWLWDATVPSDLGHFFLAINPAAFGPIEAFHERARDLLRRLKEGERAPGVEEILVAGEKEHRAHQDANLHGVRLYHTVVQSLDELGRRFSLGPLPARDEAPY